MLNFARPRNGVKLKQLKSKQKRVISKNEYKNASMEVDQQFLQFKLINNPSAKAASPQSHQSGTI
jgi:hypothetical protein